jgi:hypothetical protein
LGGHVLSLPGFGLYSGSRTVQIPRFYVPVTFPTQCNHIIESVGVLRVIERPDRLYMMYIGLLSDFFACFSTDLALMLVSI